MCFEKEQVQLSCLMALKSLGCEDHIAECYKWIDTCSSSKGFLCFTGLPRKWYLVHRIHPTSQHIKYLLKKKKTRIWVFWVWWAGVSKIWRVFNVFKVILSFWRWSFLHVGPDNPDIRKIKLTLPLRFCAGNESYFRRKLIVDED